MRRPNEAIKIGLQGCTVLGLIGVAIAVGRRDQELTETRTAFRETTGEMKSTLQKMYDLMNELNKAQAQMGEKVNSLENWRKYELDHHRGQSQ